MPFPLQMTWHSTVRLKQQTEQGLDLKAGIAEIFSICRGEGGREGGKKDGRTDVGSPCSESAGVAVREDSLVTWSFCQSAEEEIKTLQFGLCRKSAML